MTISVFKAIPGSWDAVAPGTVQCCENAKWVFVGHILWAPFESWDLCFLTKSTGIINTSNMKMEIVFACINEHNAGG